MDYSLFKDVEAFLGLLSEIALFSRRRIQSVRIFTWTVSYSTSREHDNLLHVTLVQKRLMAALE